MWDLACHDFRIIKEEIGSINLENKLALRLGSVEEILIHWDFQKILGLQQLNFQLSNMIFGYASETDKEREDRPGINIYRGTKNTIEQVAFKE